jgi:hypothetical protein
MYYKFVHQVGHWLRSITKNLHQVLKVTRRRKLALRMRKNPTPYVAIHTTVLLTS